MGTNETASVLRAHWTAVVALVLVAMIGAAGYSILSTPQYTASAEVFLAVENGSTTLELNQGSNYAQQQARNYSALAKREVVLEPVVVALGLQSTPAQLSRQIAVSVPVNTSLISISVTDPSAARASAIANAASTSLSNVVTKIVPTRRDGTSPVRLDIVQPAPVPATPSTPRPLVVVLFGGLLGLVVGIGAVLVRERFSAKVRTLEQLKQMGEVPVLGSIAFDRRAMTHPVLPALADGPRAEAFRQVRTNLKFLQTGTAHKAFVVTSSITAEGKTVSAANLAITLAESGLSVCLIEADLRRPQLQHYLGLEGSSGLTSVITGDATVEETLQGYGPHGLSVMLAGDVPPNPSELLGSNQAEAVLRALTERFDVTIVDCPPLLPVTDAALLAKALGGAILVVGAGRVETRELRHAAEALEAVGAPLLGVVLNFAAQSSTGQYRQQYRRLRTVKWEGAPESEKVA